MSKLKVGDVVRLKRGVFAQHKAMPEDFPSARVQGILSEISGGLLLDRRLRGFRFWNVRDVQKIASAKTPHNNDRNPQIR